VKSIYECGVGESREFKDHLIKHVELYQNLGEEVRICRELPIKLVIFDEKITIMLLLDNIRFDSELTTMIVHHPSFSQTQKTLFEVY
jgi:hypothetical protein